MNITSIFANAAKRLSLFLSLAIALCALGQLPARAEGGGKRPPSDWGANRRVITEGGGYTGVKGTFDGINFTLPKDVDGNVTINSNIADSKPSFYLGGTREPTSPTATAPAIGNATCYL